MKRYQEVMVALSESVLKFRRKRPLAEMMVMSYPASNKISLSRKPCILDHGLYNGFESGTAEGVELEPPEAANQDAEGVDGFSPLSNNWEILLEIDV